MNKQLTYKLLSFVEREVTIFRGDHAERNLDASLRQALMLRNLNRSVYYINSSFSAWTFMARAREILGKNATSGFMPRFRCLTAPRGQLAKRHRELRDDIGSASVVIINSWEFASCTPRLANDLLFFLRSLVTEDEITVIVWSQTDTNAEVGTIKHGGVGKLAAIARHIEPIAQALEIDANVRAAQMLDAEEGQEARDEGRVNNAPRLFVEHTVISDDGEPDLLEASNVIIPEVRELEQTPVLTDQRAIVLSRPDFDPESFDLDRVCVNLNTKYFNELQGEIPCPWENLGDAALDVMGGAYDPLSVHFAPGLWVAAMSYFNEDPSIYPPMPQVWKDVYKTRTMFRELARQCGFTFQRLSEANEEAKRYAEAKAEPDEKLREAKLKALEPKYLDGAIFWDDADIVRQRGKDGLKRVQQLRRERGLPLKMLSAN
jgi:hypothetical protein